MTALYLILSTFALVFFLGMQSLNVNGGHKLFAVLTSFGISVANITVLKIVPGPTNWLDILAYCTGGPLGILASMFLHPHLVRWFRRKS